METHGVNKSRPDLEKANVAKSTHTHTRCEKVKVIKR